MKIIYLGAEVPSNRVILEETTANHVGVSYYRLVQRGLPKTKEYLLENYFNKDFYIYVSPGLPNTLKLGPAELEEFAAGYEHFVAVNMDRLSTFYEINGYGIDPEFIDQQRKDVWSEVPPAKFVPVWQPQTGYDGLKNLVEYYLDVAIPGDAIESETQLASATRIHSKRQGTRWHALGCAKPDNLRQVPFDSASTLSWLSPMMHGETIIWDGTRLVRYPKKMKDQARSRYRHVYEKAGLDTDKILEDESKTSKISDFFEYLKESMFATLLLSVFESIDLSEVLTINPQEFMDDPSKLQEHPIVGKIQAQIQTIMKNKIEKGEFTKERIMNEFEVFKQKIQELFGDYMNETMGTAKSDLPPEIIMGNSPEARRARMLARLQRKLKDRKK